MIKLSKNRVTFWSTIAASVIGGAIVERTTAVCVMCLIKSALMATGAAITARLVVPVWGLGLIALLPALTGTVIYLLKKSLARIDPHAYNADMFLGIRWHWTMFAGDIIGLTPLCPNCTFQLTATDSPPWSAVDHVTMVCERCGFRKNFERSYPEATSYVERAIQRNLRTGEYVGILRSRGTATPTAK